MEFLRRLLFKRRRKNDTPPCPVTPPTLAAIDLGIDKRHSITHGVLKAHVPSDHTLLVEIPAIGRLTTAKILAVLKLKLEDLYQRNLLEDEESRPKRPKKMDDSGKKYLVFIWFDTAQNRFVLQREFRNPEYCEQKFSEGTAKKKDAPSDLPAWVYSVFSILSVSTPGSTPFGVMKCHYSQLNPTETLVETSFYSEKSSPLMLDIGTLEKSFGSCWWIECVKRSSKIITFFIRNTNHLPSVCK